jgi:WD40 repeat protein
MLVKGVLSTMLLSRIKLAAAGIALLAALVLVAPAILIARPTVPPETPAFAPLPITIPSTPKTPRVDFYGDPLPPGATARLGTVRHRQSSPIHKIAYSPDGKYVITDGDDEVLRVWDGDNGRLIRQIDSGGGITRDFAISCGAKLLTAGSVRDNEWKTDIVTIAVTDLVTGQRESKISRDCWGRCTLLRFSPDARLLAFDCDDHLIRVLDGATGAEHSSYKVGTMFLGRLAFSPASDRLAIVSGKTNEPQSQIHVIDLVQKKVLRMVPNFGVKVDGLGFSADGAKVASNADWDIDLWDVASGRGETFRLYPSGTITFAADGRNVAGFDIFGNLAIWDFATFGPRLAMKYGAKHSSNVGVRDWNAAVFSPDGRTLATNGGKTALHFWEIATKRDKLATPEAHSAGVDSILVTSNGKSVITSSHDATVRLWDIETGRQRRPRKPSGKPYTVALSSDERWLLAASEFRVGVNVWDLHNENAPPVISTEIPECMPVAARFSKADTQVQVYWSDGRFRAIDLPTRRLSVEKDLSASTADFRTVREDTFTGGHFLSASRRLGLSGLVHGLQFGEIETCKILYTVPDVGRFAFSHDERLLAVSRSSRDWEELVRLDVHAWRSTRSTLLILDAETGKEEFHVDVPDSTVWAMAFSPDDRTIAWTTGWAKGHIHLYDLATRKETRTITTPTLHSQLGASALAFTPDGSRIVAGMTDTSVLVWDLRSDP